MSSRQSNQSWPFRQVGQAYVNQSQIENSTMEKDSQTLSVQLVINNAIDLFANFALLLFNSKQFELGC